MYYFSESMCFRVILRVRRLNVNVVACITHADNRKGDAKAAQKHGLQSMGLRTLENN